jgi:predicted AlkP superfamily phosphohydrolase/phosphomutase
MKSAFSTRRDAAWARGAAAFAAATLAAFVLLLAHGCARETRVERRILLVGIDSADWSLIEPLMAQGKLPNLSKLVESGVSSRLRSLEPKQKSPTIWTSIATGKLPQEHGIGGYVDPATKNLMTSNLRKARTVWDILGENKRTVGVIGWLVSWPAEPLNGYMVTDYFYHVPKAGRPFPEKLAFPNQLASEIDSLRVLPESVSDALVASFADLGAAPSPKEIARLPIGQRLAEARASREEMSGLVAALRDLIASDRTFFRVARHLMGTHPTDVVAVYFRGVDTASHRFWAAAHRGRVPFEVSRTEAAVFGKTMERYYGHTDAMLGAIVRAFGDDATIIVCSDHGFEGPKRGQEIGGINDHGTVGILVMAGEGIRRGVKIDEQGVCDVTPTILALFGLPVASDMNGKVIEDALTEDFLAAHPVREIASYERPE